MDKYTWYCFDCCRQGNKFVDNKGKAYTLGLGHRRRNFCTNEPCTGTKEELEKVKKEKKVKQISKVNLQYSGVEVESYNSSCDGHCDPICRCSRIIYEKVTEINIKHIVREILINPTAFSELDIYCMEKIFRLAKLTEDCFYIAKRHGYYGEEIDGVYLEGCQDIETQIWHIINKTDRDKIEYILALEYGYLLEEVKGCRWSLEELKPKEIKLNDNYRKKVAGEYPEYDSKDIMGVCVRKGKRVHLIDGYHRYHHIDRVDADKAHKYLVGIRLP